MSDTLAANDAQKQAEAAVAGTWRDYVALLKPRVMSLVVFTGFAGLIAAPGDIHPLTALMTLICIAGAAGASGALNMWYDADIDAVMQRTRRRPIPRGAVMREDALAFGIALAVVSTFVMWVMVNVMAAALLALTVLFYIVIYTMWLKRRTPQNIVIGGAAGALPPVIGWAAVTGDVTLEPIVLFLIIFMWTPPHFWALSLYRTGDYAKAGVPMLPVVAGHSATRNQIVLYTILLVPLSLAPGALGTAGWLYTGVTALLGVVFLGLTIQLWAKGRVADEKDEFAQMGLRRIAQRVFAFSTLYLFILFSLLVVERLAGIEPLPRLVSL